MARGADKTISVCNGLDHIDRVHECCDGSRRVYGHMKRQGGGRVSGGDDYGSHIERRPAGDD
jgi:hypothetical protein